MKKIKHLHLPHINMSQCFVLCTLVSIILTLAALFFTHGKLFNQIFYSDSLDTGMDFFHSIEYTRGRAPYNLYETLYPPLANLCFYLLFRFVPDWQHNHWASTFEDGIAARGTVTDLRLWQPTLFMFMVLIMITALILFLLIQKITLSTGYATIISICSLFSYGVMYALERGNIIILCVICCLFFVSYKDSSNKFLAELALLALAFAAGLKLYPAILGLLLLYDKQYKKAIRAVIYGILFFILPFFIFREGISGLTIFLTVLSRESGVYALTTRGLSIDKMINSIVFLFAKISNIEIPFEHLVQLLHIGPKFNVIAFLAAVSGFFVTKRWQKVLACCLTIILYQTQGLYILGFLLIPFLIMIAEEKSLSPSNVLPYISILLTQLLLPIGEGEDALMKLSLKYGRFQICIVILFIYIIAEAIRSIKKARFSPQKRKHPINA